VEKEQASRYEQAVVEALVYGGEGPFVEFKGAVPNIGAAQTDRVFNTIAAYANGAGGTVVFGVDRNELTVLGLGEDIDPNKERDRIGQLIRTRILPTPDFTITPYTIAEKIVLLVEVRPGAAPPYGVITDLNHRDQPKFYVRHGASTYPAQPSDLNRSYDGFVA
jgi:predicted HTH transcriptional regulator